VSIEMAELKARLLKLLEEDAEFRYAVAGLIGLSEILKRLDRHEEELVRIREEQKKIWERLAKIDEEIAKLWNEVVKLREDTNKLREDMVKGFERYDQQFIRVWSEIERLREDMIKGFERHDKELTALREEQRKIWEEIARLREDMAKGFERLDRRISALGAKWGIESEEAFREDLKGILEKELGFKVEKWKVHDDKGVVFGYPSDVEVDVAVVDRKVILIEVSSHVKASDVYTFKRKAELYKENTGREADRLIIVTPYADEKAFEAAAKLGIEIYTKV